MRVLLRGLRDRPVHLPPPDSSLRTRQGSFGSGDDQPIWVHSTNALSALLSYSFLVRRNAVATHMRGRRTNNIGEKCMHSRWPIRVTYQVVGCHDGALWPNRPGAGKGTSRC